MMIRMGVSDRQQLELKLRLLVLTVTLGDIDKRKCTWRSDHVDQVKTAVEQVERRLWKTWWSGGPGWG